MLISEIKRYIKSKKAVSITDLTIEFGADMEILEMPLKILIDKGVIQIVKAGNNDESNTKCKGCPMTCKPKDVEECSTSEPFNIYTWVEN